MSDKHAATYHPAEDAVWIPCPCVDQVAQEHHTCTYCDDHLGHWVVEPTATH